MAWGTCHGDLSRSDDNKRQSSGDLGSFYRAQRVTECSVQGHSASNPRSEPRYGDHISWYAASVGRNCPQVLSFRLCLSERGEGDGGMSLAPLNTRVE